MKDEKRMAGDYKIIQAIVIGDKEIVIGENQADTNGQKYMTAVGEWNDLFEFYDQVLVSDDYPEIVGYFGQRVAEQAKKTRDELFRPSFQGIENCKDLYTGKESRYERRDVLGTMEPDTLPEWVQYGLYQIRQDEKQPKETNKEAR